jgi:hypothetical protein
MDTSIKRYINGSSNFETYHEDDESHESIIEVLSVSIENLIKFRDFLIQRDKDKINKIDPVHYTFVVAVPNLNHDSIQVASFGHIGVIGKTVTHTLDGFHLGKLMLEVESDKLIDEAFTDEDDFDEPLPTPFDIDLHFNDKNNEA